MRLLLDTHVMLWWLTDDAALPESVRAAIVASDSEVFVSAASAWEIAIKHSLDRLDFPVEQMPDILDTAGFTPLPIAIAHAVAAGALPRHHADPFDRMIVAQAQCEGLTVVSLDRQIARYAVSRLP